jgi:calcineurin-like phosphoesterase family protein
MNTWFTADTHFAHRNIITYTNRPFKTVEEMNLALIRNWNERVKKEDSVFVIGDFSFKSANERGNGQNIKYDYWLSQLNGNIILLQGNHDIRNGVKTKIQSIIIKIGKEYIELIHDPEHISGRTNIALVGHVHQNWECKRIVKGCSFIDCVNVGVDVFDFKPVTWEEILKRLHQWRRKEKLL